MLRTFQIILFLAAAAGLFRLSFGTDPARLHRPAPVMARGERAVSEACGLGNTRFRVVDLSAWQCENAELKARWLGVTNGLFLAAADLPPEMTVAVDGRPYAVLPSEDGIDLSARLAELFGAFEAETVPLLAGSFAALALALLLVFRGRFPAYAAPIAAALVATAGVLGWIGSRVNLFQLISFFILTGLGIDYTIFHRAEESGGRRNGSRIVLFSFLTSLAGFGLLAFTSFEVTRSMGVTLAVGLFFAYVFSLRPAARGETAGRPAAADWSGQREQSAGRVRIALMWYLYRFLGKDAAKLLFLPAWLFIYPWCRPGREALRQFYGVIGIRGNAFRQMLGFAWSLLDKVDACTLKKNLPLMTLAGDTGWLKGGCFLLSTHVGCIEVLPALRQRLAGSRSGGTSIRVHAFQQMGHDAVFTSLFLRHLDPAQLTLHAVEEIGVETAVEMQDAVRRGDIVLMAGDRLSANAGRTRQLRHGFLGRDCVWPKGVFRFAKLMECPVYAIVCVKTGWNAYTVEARRMGDDLLGDYVRFLEDAVRARPGQWYQFYRFFDPPRQSSGAARVTVPSGIPSADGDA